MTTGGHDGTTMSDTHGTTHAADAPPEPDPSHPGAAGGGGHHADQHGGGHDAGGHGHVTEPLGPISWAMWGAGVLGVVAALAVVYAFVLGTGFSFTA
jgi:hypothetical protein